MDGGHDVLKDIDADREHRVVVLFPKVLLNAPYKLLDLQALTSLEGQVVVGVQGADLTQVLLDSCGPYGPKAKVRHPFNDGQLGGQQWGTVRVGQMGVELDEIKKLVLPHCNMLKHSLQRRVIENQPVFERSLLPRQFLGS